MDPIKTKIHQICTDYSSETLEWKTAVLELNAICDDPNCPFDKNVRDGLYHLNGIIYMMMCSKCGDKKAYDWFDAFCVAITQETAVPPFPVGCITESCDSPPMAS